MNALQYDETIKRWSQRIIGIYSVDIDMDDMLQAGRLAVLECFNKHLIPELHQKQILTCILNELQNYATEEHRYLSRNKELEHE